MNVQELMKKVAELQQQNAEQIRERAEVARLEATIKLESNPALVEARARLQLKNDQTEVLQRMVDECAGIIANVPVYNTKTRTERIWAGNHRYNYGTQIDLMYQLATGILYSCQEHKQLLLAHVPVNTELLEQFIKAFGTPSYYSRNNNVVVESKPYNVEELIDILNIMQSTLGVVIDTDEITDSNLEMEFLKADAKAYKDLHEAEEAINNADFVL